MTDTPNHDHDHDCGCTDHPTVMGVASRVGGGITTADVLDADGVERAAAFPVLTFTLNRVDDHGKPGEPATVAIIFTPGMVAQATADILTSLDRAKDMARDHQVGLDEVDALVNGTES